VDPNELHARVRAHVAAGDVEGAAPDALRALGPSVLRYLRSLLRDEDDAADAFSRFAEDLWKGIGAWRGDASLRGWAFRLAHHAAIDEREGAWRRRGRRFQSGEASRIADEVRTRTVVRVERQRRALDKLREALAPSERSLLALRVDQELSWAEVAEALAPGGAADAPAVMKRFERLRERLARMARDEGLVE
jgi:RNA polymerase sigma-70 factor (ECF subfamily)